MNNIEWEARSNNCKIIAPLDNCLFLSDVFSALAVVAVYSPLLLPRGTFIIS